MNYKREPLTSLQIRQTLYSNRKHIRNKAIYIRFTVYDKIDQVHKLKATTFIMRKLILLLMVGVGFLASCRQPTSDPPTYTYQIPTANLDIVSIFLDAGELSVAGSTSAEIRISSTTDCETETTGKTLEVDCQHMEKGDKISMDLPRSLELEIESYQANISLKGSVKTVQVKNTAGDNIWEDFVGNSSLWAGRGDISVKGGEGSLEMFSEHGSITVSGFNGVCSLATIMGNINFQAIYEGVSPINLESDHGTISALLPSNSNYRIRANTASGDVICLGGNLRLKDSGCQGSTGPGKGMFEVRTVSGRIELRILP
ncbi:MAG: DUF4097 family beta strand repeat-containing protein [Anaerolineales bacterium]